jgi:SAM-dependent methyltransferase
MLHPPAGSENNNMIRRPFLSRLRETAVVLRRLAKLGHNPVRFTKFIPQDSEAGTWTLHYRPVPASAPLPVPPKSLWLGYGQDEKSYLESGLADVAQMRSILERAGFRFEDDGRSILDLGCGGGRMIRHLRAAAGHREVWGMDISAPHINWLKMHLSPPFRFAVNTTIPHLPFADGSLDLVYCGSLFTHIDDLAESWLLEVRRILADNALLYCTLHDEHALAQLAREPFHGLASALRDHPALTSADPPDVFVAGYDSDSTVFYRTPYLRALFGQSFDLVEVVPAAYGYQTAWVLRKRPAR